MVNPASASHPTTGRVLAVVSIFVLAAVECSTGSVAMGASSARTATRSRGTARASSGCTSTRWLMGPHAFRDGRTRRRR